MNFVQALSSKYDLLVNRYQCFFAEDAEDKDACLKILEAVRYKELNRISGKSVLESHAFSGKNLSFRMAACRDSRTGEIIGCIRSTPATEAASVPSSRVEYCLDIFEHKEVDQLEIFTRLAVLKDYRKSPAAMVLMSFCFKDVLTRGGHGILMSCEPNLLPLYKHLGLRPIGPMHNSPSGGYRIPMICLPDKSYFKAIQSPALPLLKEIDFAKYQDICKRYLTQIARQLDLEIGADLYSKETDQYQWHKIITEGLSKKGLKSFLKNAINLKCKKGDLLIAENDGGKSFGFVKHGIIEVLIDDDNSVPLQAGYIFGEIAFVLDIHRSAKVIAATENTEVVMFSMSALHRLETEQDQVVIWRNLAKILARKLLNTNKILQ